MSGDTFLEVISYLDKKIRVTKEYWNRIIATKHKIMKGKGAFVKEALQNPEEIRRSKKDKNVFLHYKKINEKYACVVVKHLNGEGFIITTYLTDRIKMGEEYETN